MLTGARKEHPALREAIDRFKEEFGCDPDVKVFAPGRVNLIGEHTDYNGGFVLPFALPFKTVVVGSISDTRETKVVSCTMKSSVETFVVSRELTKGVPSWLNYVKGTIYQYLCDIQLPVAYNICIASNVPLGSGLSSSASLEVAIATFLERAHGINTNGITKALRCQKAEHDFAGTPCGIMDQYISSMGKKGCLLLIDCRSNEHTVVPFGSGEIKRPPVLLITNSNVKHSLSDSQYPIRVKQCREAVRALARRNAKIKSLRDASTQDVEAFRGDVSDVIYRRALHCVTEDIRTQTTANALKKGDFDKVGQQMTMSHASLAGNFEVSCAELDLLVELALEVPGVYGSRMTGGGFGGCTITLVDRDSVRTLEMHLRKQYFEKTGKKCLCYDAFPCEGAGSFGGEDTQTESSFSRTKSNWTNIGFAIVVAIASIVISYYLPS